MRKKSDRKRREAAGVAGQGKDLEAGLGKTEPQFFVEGVRVVYGEEQGIKKGKKDVNKAN